MELLSARRAAEVLKISAGLVQALGEGGLLGPTYTSGTRATWGKARVAELAARPVLAPPHPALLCKRVAVKEVPDSEDKWPFQADPARSDEHARPWVGWVPPEEDARRDGWRGWWQRTDPGVPELLRRLKARKEAEADDADPTRLPPLPLAAASLAGYLVDVQAVVQVHEFDAESKPKAGGDWLIFDFDDPSDQERAAVLHHWLPGAQWPQRCKWFPAEGWVAEGEAAWDDITAEADRLSLLVRAFVDQGVPEPELVKRLGLTMATVRQLRHLTG
jgi:hypothetical protein